MVNRVWRNWIGRGFVNPVDDFRDDNKPSHPKALNFLADEFVASGYDFRFLVKAVLQSEAYPRGHLPGNVPTIDRLAAEKAVRATPVRRMNSETLFDSIVQAGHLFTPKHRPGENRPRSRPTRKSVAEEDPTKPSKTKSPGGDGAFEEATLPEATTWRRASKLTSRTPSRRRTAWTSTR